MCKFRDSSSNKIIFKENWFLSKIIFKICLSKLINISPDPDLDPDSDPNSAKIQNPYPNSMYLDPKLC